MTPPPIDVERIVREVLARIGRAPAAGGGDPMSSASPSDDRTSNGSPSSVSKEGNNGASRAAVATPPDELVVDSPVVTLSDLDGRLDVVRRVVVRPQAVVTPAVRDELKRRHVALTYSSGNRCPTADRLRLVVVGVGKRAEPAMATVARAAAEVNVQQHRSNCLIESTDRLAAEVAEGGALGILLTRYPAAGVCLANRHPGVRMIQAVDPTRVASEAETVGANLLVIDPTAVSSFQLQRTVTEFCRDGVRPCPGVFQERLGPVTNHATT